MIALPPKGRAFLDTNVLVYAFDDRSPRKQSRSQAIIAESLDKRRGIISYQVVQEFVNVACNKFPGRFSTREARVFLTDVLWALCEVLPDPQLYADALEVREETGWTYYDSLIVSAAARSGCSVLLSEDLQSGRVVRGVAIRNPFA